MQIHTDENPLLATRFGVRGVPVIILVRNGKGVTQYKGAQTAEAVLAWFARQP